MRRDIGFYVEAGLEQVYSAYLMAATHEPFERDCKQEPYHTISFGVNYSFKYNMNGGACTIHFMPYGNGTAVNMRFSIAQAVGARYERYAEDLNRAMAKILPVAIREAKYDMDEFLRPENQVTPADICGTSVSPRTTPIAADPAPAPAPASTIESSESKFCSSCGARLDEGARFCSKCGRPVSAPAKKLCPSCGKEDKPDDAFCSSCGSKL